MTTAAHLDTVNVGLSDNDGRGSTIRDAFTLVNDNINKLNFQLNSDGYNSSQYPATYLTVTNDIYANAGTIQGATIKGSAIFVNGSPVLTSASGGWNGGTVEYYGIFANTDPSYSTTTGVVQVAGGVGIQGNLNLGGLLNVGGNVTMGNVLASGKLSINNINTTGTGTFNELIVAAGSTLSGTTLLAGPSIFNGIPTFNAASAFNNDASFFANLNISGSIVGSGSLDLFEASLTQATVGTFNATSIQARAIGNVTPGSGVFTTLGCGGRLTVTNAQSSTSTTSGAIVVTGGVGIGGDVYVGGNLVVQGSTLTVNTEIINQSVVIASSITSPTVIANTLNAATIGNISANHVGTGTYLTSLNGANLNNSSVPNSALANSSVTVSAGAGMSGGGAVALGGTVTLTNAGVTGLTAGSGISISASTGNVTVSVSTAPTFASISHSGTSGVGDIGSSGNTFGTVYATATSAKYADVAENYKSDSQYEPGTVVAFGGSHEVTVAEDGTRKVAGVVSTNPAYLMNSCCDSEFVVAVALQGRVPVKVRGKVEKGDMMVSAGSGFARADFNPILGSVIGKALEDFNGVEGVIEVVVGRL
jgi:pyruvoyl-dependent arginine decarboxylase (PvlArgDC)